MDWIMDMFINLCLLIDNMIYSVNVLLFKLFLAVSNGKFVDSVFHEFFARLYVIIGIFMIFKVAFSLIQMLSNPDLMTDKEKGAGKLASQIVIALGLIIMVPTIFTMAFDLQSAVLSENIIGKLLFGGTFDENDNTGNINENTIDTQGRFIAITVFKGMINIPDEIKDSGDAAVNACDEALKSSEYSTIDSLRKVNNNIDCFTYQVQDKRIYDYKVLVSSIATGMVAWLMVGFCIDVAVRLFKLGALELIAPICIVTYVGGGKDNAFNKWTKLTISTYVSVFIKLITIYFVIYFAGIIGDRDTLIINTEVPLVNVALILGLLVFAKNAPKLIGDLFGVKQDEESGFKGLAKTALLGAGALTASAGLAGASNIARGIGNTIGAVKEARANGASGWKAGLLGGAKTLASGLGGVGAGAFLGAKNGFNKNATFGGTVNKALMTSNANREQRADRSSIGYGPLSRAGDFLKGAAGLDTKAKEGAIAAKNRLAGLQNSRSVLAQRQIENANRMDPNVLSKLASYTYDAKNSTWIGTNGQAITEADMYNQLGIDPNATMPVGSPPPEIVYEDFFDSNGNFVNESAEAYYNEYMKEYNDYMSQVEQYNSLEYMKQSKEISEMDGQIIKAEKEVKKWETEQNAVERKTSSGNK